MAIAQILEYFPAEVPMAANADPSCPPGDGPWGGRLDLGVMDQLLDLDDGGVGLLEEMLGLFKEDTPERIQAMGAALAAGRPEEMADLAHAVKGAASTMGAPRVRALAAELEAAGRLRRWDREPAQALDLLQAAFGEAVEALEAFLAARKAGA
jgi:HPt (histidine-containing phosphotransfer) domain-containing protein